jgi:hypothetical protein
LLLLEPVLVVVTVVVVERVAKVNTSSTQHSYTTDSMSTAAFTKHKGTGTHDSRVLILVNAEAAV